MEPIYEGSTTPEPFRPEMLDGHYLGVVLLDPAGARHLLGFNAKNRKIRATRVEQYADAIVDGRWQLSPDAIAVEHGQLVNGQHRCRAVIDAGETIPILLMNNLGSAFDVTDNGASRTAADVLFLAGLTDWPGSLAAATKLYLRESGVSNATMADNRFVERWVIEHAELDGWVSHFEPVARDTRNPTSRLYAGPVAVLSYAIERGEYGALIAARQSQSQGRPPTRVQTDRDTVMALGHQTVTGLGLDDDADPIYVVRAQIARMLDSRSTATTVRAPMILDVVTKAWHAKLQDRHPTRYKFGSVGEWPYGQPEQQALDLAE